MNDFQFTELCGTDMSQNDFETVSEIIHEVLLEKGIFCDSFSWSIDIEYMPQEFDNEINS